MLEILLRPEVEELIQARDLKTLRETLSGWEPQEIAALIDELAAQDDVVVFRVLSRDLAARTFEHLSLEKQEELIEAIAENRQHLSRLLNDLSPDDRTALLEELPGPVTRRLLGLLSPEERKVATMLLGYPEDSIGRLMTTDFVAVRPELTVEQALEHIRRFGKDSETLNVIYVIDASWKLVDDLRIREILLSDRSARIEDLMDGRYIALSATDDQEKAVQIFRDYDRVALPVVDTQGILVGIVTIDDVVDVLEEEVTEDIQKIGGSEALDEPYMDTPLRDLVSKRARWLIVLFVGEMLTTSAMTYFEGAIAKAVILALFVPLIISSGGNSGSQAATLIIRSMAVGEISLLDWWRVMRREVLSGLSLGGILGVIGIIRVIVWGQVFDAYGEHWMLIALTVGFSLVGVVMLGTLAGSMLPFLLKKLGADPAASSAPFVATLVDVAGVLIYFGMATLLLTGTLL